MSETASSSSPLPAVPPRLRQLCDRFAHLWRTGTPPRIEDYLGVASGEERAVLLRMLVQMDIFFRRRHGQQPCLEEYRQRFPTLDAEWLANELAVNSAAN